MSRGHVGRQSLRLLIGVCIILSSAFLIDAANAEGQSNFPSPREQVITLGAGINAFSYDPVWKSQKNARIKDSHLRKMKDAGFRTIRVNLMSFAYMDSSGRLDPEWLSTLDDLIARLLSFGFNIILDEHDFIECREDVELCERRLIDFWSQISIRYRNSPPTVLFELLNEPSRDITPSVWNGMSRRLLEIIRRSNPKRNVLIGPAHFNSIDYLDRLEIPVDDKNIIVTVHYYLPLEFSHQRFPMGNWFPTLPLRGWGGGKEQQKVMADFYKAQNWAERNNRVLYLGEFGTYEQAPLADRAKYAGFLTRTAESLGWAWAYWQFDKSFSLYDIEGDKWVEPILSALIPGK
ncbi:Endoglucanase H [compost metagenome]